MKSRRINSISYRMERNTQEQISLPTWWDKTQKNQSHFLHDGMKSRRINSISYTMGWRAEEPISVPAWRDESRRSNLTSYAMEWSAEESISLPTRWDKKLKNQSHFLHESMNIRRVNLTSYTKFVAHVSTKSKLYAKILQQINKGLSWVRKNVKKWSEISWHCPFKELAILCKPTIML